jgi:RimJ/RimL family protein N-acetyltransferase
MIGVRRYHGPFPFEHNPPAPRREAGDPALAIRSPTGFYGEPTSVPHLWNPVENTSVPLTDSAPSVVDWRVSLPVLRGTRVTLREPIVGDARSLFAEICTPEVTRYVPPPPATAAGVEQTIRRGIDWRRLGRGFCFAVVPASENRPVGLVQFLGSRRSWVRVSTRTTWEWGFALGADHWGKGIFTEAASLALQFAFATIGLRRVEAWIIEENVRANAAMSKLRAERRLFRRVISPDGRLGDFVRWTIRGS